MRMFFLIALLKEYLFEIFTFLSW